MMQIMTTWTHSMIIQTHKLTMLNLKQAISKKSFEVRMLFLRHKLCFRFDITRVISGQNLLSWADDNDIQKQDNQKADNIKN